MSPFPLESLQLVAAERLASNSMFDGTESANHLAVPVVSELKGDIQNQLEVAIAKIGLCIVILTPLFRLNAPDVMPGSLDGFAHLVVSVHESRQMNPSGIHALTAAQHILGLLHGFPHGLPASAGEEPVFKSDPGQDSIMLTVDVPALQYSVPFVARLVIARPS